MSVVELDSNLVRKLGPRALRLLEPPNDVVERRGNPEVLLLETEFLSSLEVVVGVQNRTDGLGALLVGDRAFVVATIEFLKVELAASRLARPKSEVVRGRSIISRNRNIIRDRGHGLATFPVRDREATCAGRFVNRTVELNLQNGSANLAPLQLKIQPPRLARSS